MIDFTGQYLDVVREVAARVDRGAIEHLVERLSDLRAQGGRLFFPGVGGSAGNPSHAVNDFRELCGFEAYTPTGNVSELPRLRTAKMKWESLTG